MLSAETNPSKFQESFRAQGFGAYLTPLKVKDKLLHDITSLTQEDFSEFRRLHVQPIYWVAQKAASSE